MKNESRETRLNQGREQRRRFGRKELGLVHAPKRAFDPVELLLNSQEGRLPKLLPEKYARMRSTAFAFFRGSVSIMAADLAGRPHTGILVQLCGDAHLQNLGSFEGPDGRLIFDINDFDETIEGPWEWDVKRMAASIVLAGFDSEHRASGCGQAVEVFAAAYCRAIEELAEVPVLTAARFQIRRAKRVQAVSAAIKQSQRASPCDLRAKYAETGARGSVKFKPIDKQILKVSRDTRRQVLEALPVYEESLGPERLHLFRYFRPQDVAFKIVGTGSVGLRDYIVLMEGNGPGDPLFLQIKQEERSAYAPYLQNSTYAHQGRRVVEGQRRIQPLSDPLLGWTRVGAHDYLVRQLNDHKGSVDLRNLRGNGLDNLAAIAGELLARGHARSGDPLVIKGYIGAEDKTIKAITTYAMAYADQTQSDFETFKTAIEHGQIKIAA